jgi:hypothetical protein
LNADDWAVELRFTERSRAQSDSNLDPER